MTVGSRPVLAIDPSSLKWQSPSELVGHFVDHSRDEGDCLKKSLSRGAPFTVDGYMQTQRDAVQRVRFLIRALIRNRWHPDSKHKKRTWAFAPNLFCVGMALGTNEVVTAFHNHLGWRQHGHKLFERANPTEKHKEDAFLDWLSRGEALAASAKVLLGSNISHEITDVERLHGFPAGD
jgi:hypothetical protein